MMHDMRRDMLQSIRLSVQTRLEGINMPCNREPSKDECPPSPSEQSKAGFLNILDIHKLRLAVEELHLHVLSGGERQAVLADEQRAAHPAAVTGHVAAVLLQEDANRRWNSSA